jgi:hypothetical protein
MPSPQAGHRPASALASPAGILPGPTVLSISCTRGSRELCIGEARIQAIPPVRGHTFARSADRMEPGSNGTVSDT